MIERVYSYDLMEKRMNDILSVIKPVEDDRNKRLRAIQEIVNSIYSVGALRGATVKPFGSFASNLYAKSGDLDVSVELCTDSNFHTSKKKKQDVLRELMTALEVRGVATYMHFIPTARVPVLQYVSKLFGISCDISINNYPGRIKSRILYWVNTIDERFGDVVLLVKEWAKSQNVNDPKNGTLNSYSLSLLVLFHFQTCEPAILPPMKEIYDVNIAGDITGMAFYNERHLDEVCMANIAKFRRQNAGKRNESSLLQLITILSKSALSFSHLDSYSSDVISTYAGQIKRIQDNPHWMDKSYCLFVEDPFDRPDNAARTVSMEEFHRIARAFKYSGYIFPAPNVLRSLCTPEVCSELDRLRQLVAANTHRASGFSGNRAVHSPRGYNSGRQAAAPYQGQQRRREHTSDHQANRRAVTTRYGEPVGGRLRNGSTRDSRSQASSNSTTSTWQR